MANFLENINENITLFTSSKRCKNYIKNVNHITNVLIQQCNYIITQSQTTSDTAQVVIITSYINKIINLKNNLIKNCKNLDSNKKFITGNEILDLNDEELKKYKFKYAYGYNNKDETYKTESISTGITGKEEHKELTINYKVQNYTNLIFTFKERKSTDATGTKKSITFTVTDENGNAVAPDISEITFNIGENVTEHPETNAYLHIFEKFPIGTTQPETTNSTSTDILKIQSDEPKLTQTEIDAEIGAAMNEPTDIESGKGVATEPEAAVDEKESVEPAAEQAAEQAEERGPAEPAETEPAETEPAAEQVAEQTAESGPVEAEPVEPVAEAVEADTGSADTGSTEAEPAVVVETIEPVVAEPVVAEPVVEPELQTKTKANNSIETTTGGKRRKHHKKSRKLSHKKKTRKYRRNRKLHHNKKTRKQRRNRKYQRKSNKHHRRRTH